MFASFTRHPKAVGESYGEHMGVAWSFGFTLLGAGLACIVHGILPFAFERTGSQTVRRLNERLSNRCAQADKHLADAHLADAHFAAGETARG